MFVACVDSHVADVFNPGRKRHTVEDRRRIFYAGCRDEPRGTLGTFAIDGGIVDIDALCIQQKDATG